MKTYILSIFILSIIFSCDKEKNTYVYYDKKKDLTHVVNYIKKDNKIYLDGKSIAKNSKGIMLVELNYKNDKLDGFQKVRHLNGILKSIYFYKNGIKQNDEKIYDERGRLIEERKYNKNKIVFEEIYYYKNNIIENLNFYDYKGGMVFYINFDNKGNIIQKKGYLAHCFIVTDKIKFGEKLKIDCMLANIPNTERKVEFIYSDSEVGKRTIKNKGDNFLRIEELKYRKGKNSLYFIVTYKFNKKYHNQFVKDTAFIDYYVN